MGGKGALGEESRRAAQGRKAPGYGAPNNNSVPCSSFFAPGEGEGLPKLRPTKGKGELAFTSTRSAKPHRSVEPFFVTGTAALCGELRQNRNFHNLGTLPLSTISGRQPADHPLFYI